MTPEPTAAPEWCKPGEEVAVMEKHGRSRGVSKVVIKSVGKRYVITKNGTRYDLQHNLEQVSSNPWGPTWQLCSLSDERVQAAIREYGRQSSGLTAAALVKAWVKSNDPEQLQKAVDLLRPYLEVSS
jgi:hypothetical protein